jgi:hypothetical protein
MKNLLVCFLTLVLAIAAAADKGDWNDPYQGNGPIGAWVTNGKWLMRATEVKVVPDFASFQALPWTERRTPDLKKKMDKFVGKIYKRDKAVALVRIEFKNLTDEKQEVGYSRPVWVLRCADGQEATTSRTQIQWVMWCLEGASPKKTLLNPNDKAGGWLAFYIPSSTSPKALYFKAKHAAEGDFGKTDTLVMGLQKASD